LELSKQDICGGEADSVHAENFRAESSNGRKVKVGSSLGGSQGWQEEGVSLPFQDYRMCVTIEADEQVFEGGGGSRGKRNQGPFGVVYLCGGIWEDERLNHLVGGFLRACKEVVARTDRREAKSKRGKDSEAKVPLLPQTGGGCSASSLGATCATSMGKRERGEKEEYTEGHLHALVRGGKGGGVRHFPGRCIAREVVRFDESGLIGRGQSWRKIGGNGRGKKGEAEEKELRKGGQNALGSELAPRVLRKERDCAKFFLWRD